MDKYKNKHRIASTHLQHWDYRWSGAYFMTIFTQNREHFFGEIVDGKIPWSHVGIIANILWHQIPHHANNVELGKFVVMPNHIHGTVIISDNTDSNDVGTKHALSLRLQPSSQPPTRQSSNKTPIQPLTISQQGFQNIGENSTSSIVGSYKSAVTKHANRLGLVFQWQSRFHDYIIRGDQSFQKISEYIENNPTNWQDDKFHNSNK